MTNEPLKTYRVEVITRRVEVYRVTAGSEAEAEEQWHELEPDRGENLEVLGVEVVDLSL